NSKHHADVVEYEEDTNPGGGQVTTESNLVEFDEESTKGIVTGAVSDHTTIEDTKEYTTESNLIELVDELPMILKDNENIMYVTSGLYNNNT
ncbi:hypothetical protein P7888_14285, partial [Staphylococcus aureus]|nr:hypothetical protein [Staphylococcus aureus]